MADNNALDRLATLAGIEEGWIDFFGQYRPVSDETKRAFLSAMGFNVESEGDVVSSLIEMETKPWRRHLDPVLVWPERNGPPTISLTLPAARRAVVVDWTVTEENGTLHTGQWSVDAATVIAERTIDGTLLRRYACRLPGVPLPGVHRLRISGGCDGEAAMTLIVTPNHAYLPQAARGDRRLWGYATQLYALKSESNWGIGDFSDLADLACRAGRQGAAAIGVNPLHALFASRPERFSPYSPSSRKFLNIAYIDVEAVPDFDESAEAQTLFGTPVFQAQLTAARDADLVDYVTIGRLKRTVLEACWTSFRAKHLEGGATDRGRSFAKFRQESGRDLTNFAVFEALQAHFLAIDPDKGFWRLWPAKFRDPDGAAVRAFAKKDVDRVDFHLYLQWLADGQLMSAQEACDAAGMPVGIYRDLGVGIADDGAEAWANQSLLCHGVSIGAPPDPLNLAGQDWGLVPFNPIALQEEAYLPFLDVLEANMRHAGAMRLDHAMSLQRLYWVPQGAKADQGAYVRYPVEDLFGLVALASRRRNCLVIGEDLGTVPDGFRQRMDDNDILGYRLLVFEKVGDRLRPPDQFPGKALIGFGTHDLPSLVGWWAAIDVEARQRLALYPDSALGESEVEQRLLDRRLLVEALHAAGLIKADFSTSPTLSVAQMERLSQAIHVYLAQTPAKLLMVQFEDVLGLSLQMNLPGTTDQHPNWRVRYPLTIGAMVADRRLVALAKRLSRERPCLVFEEERPA
ncbi:MAG TPA: 4-alpha-glucanotransferase [Telmatospirillum sp.]|nr:4-alpha-glucanotransferase [Telmatospirillum sp.]